MVDGDVPIPGFRLIKKLMALLKSYRLFSADNVLKIDGGNVER